MKIKKPLQNKSGQEFSSGVFIVILTISISLFAFISEGNNITGFATLDNKEAGNTKEEISIIPNNLMEFNDIKSITLAAGNYYVDDEGIIYWIDDESRPPVARLKNIDEIQKNKNIYIDDEGRVGYVLSQVLTQNQ